MESRHWSNNGGKTLTLKKADSQLQRVFHENHAIFVQSRVVILMGMDPAPLISWHVLGQLFSCTPGIRHYWFFRLSGFRLKLFELPVTRVLDSGRATNPIILGPQFNVKVKAARYKFYWENIYPCNFNYVYSKLFLFSNFFRKTIFSTTPFLVFSWPRLCLGDLVQVLVAWTSIKPIIILAGQ